MYNYENFIKTRNKIIAKNILLEKICDNCFYLHGGVMKCEYIHSRSFFSNGTITDIKPLPKEKTCINWRVRTN